MEWWKEQFPEDDREIYEKANMGKISEIGSRPALLIIDVLYAFTGTSPKPVLEAIEEFPASCGEYAWNALPYIKNALQTCRDYHIPKIFVKADPKHRSLFGSTTKRPSGSEVNDPMASQIHQMIQPLDDEYVLTKTKASAFFDTPLSVSLHKLGVDSVILAGCTTSGCVRATAVDGHSHGFSMFVLEDACFDRSPYSHRNSLFELNSKYASVIQTETFCEKIILSHGR